MPENSPARGRRIDDRETVARDLAPYAGADRPQYPVTYRVEVSPALLAAVASAVSEAPGWPVVRHRADYVRLAQALRWFASGGPVTRPRGW
jgi:hypothetical protein